MCLNIFVFCTDERQRYLSQSLYGIKKSPDESMKRQSDYNVWVLPTPLYKYDIAILNERFQKEIVTGSNIAFAGAVNETWRDYFCENVVISSRKPYKLISNARNYRQQSYLYNNSQQNVRP